ncbi:MAG: hypothetical protein AAGF79_05835 [Pseudomonadota bacterium]
MGFGLEFASFYGRIGVALANRFGWLASSELLAGFEYVRPTEDTAATLV